MTVGLGWLERLDLLGEIHIVQIPYSYARRAVRLQIIQVSSHANTNLMTLLQPAYSVAQASGTQCDLMI